MLTMTKAEILGQCLTTQEPVTGFDQLSNPTLYLSLSRSIRPKKSSAKAPEPKRPITS